MKKSINNYKKYLLLFLWLILTSIVIGCLIYILNIIRKPRVIKCNQQYALCPAAKCVPDPIYNNIAYCNCYVENGVNYSYGNKTCSELSPRFGTHGEQYIYSTFSPIIKSLGFKRITCPSKNTNLNCMNQICSINPNNTNQAICRCKNTNNNGSSWNAWVKSDSSCNYISGSSNTMTDSLSSYIDNENK